MFSGKRWIRQALEDPDYIIITNYEVHWEIIPIKKNPKRRIVWSEEMNSQDIEDLQERINMALTDPDYAIVTNYEVHWDEK